MCLLRAGATDGTGAVPTTAPRREHQEAEPELARRVRQTLALGIAHYMGAFSRGGLAHDKVTRSMRLFAEKVMPRFG